MIEVKRWWLARRLIGKQIFGNVGMANHFDWWDMDSYTDDGWVGGPSYISLLTFIKAIFSKPKLGRKPWKTASRGGEG